MSIPSYTYRYIAFAGKEVTQGIIISKPDHRNGVMAYYFVPPGYKTAVEHSPVLVNRNARKNHAQNRRRRTNIWIWMGSLGQPRLGFSYYLANRSWVRHLPGPTARYRNNQLQSLHLKHKRGPSDGPRAEVQGTTVESGLTDCAQTRRGSQLPSRARYPSEQPS